MQPAYPRRTEKRIIFAALCALSLMLSVAGADEYRLGPGDTVKITVYGHPDLATTARINETGKIGFPLIGEIALSKFTTQQAGRRIAQALSTGGFVQRPQVTVSIERAYSPLVSILGEVNKPGKYPLRNPETPESENVRSVSDLLALAGGPKDSAADYLTLIQHKGGGETVHHRVDLTALLRRGDLSQNLPIKEGDIVFVPRTEMFYIYGEVQKPGAYRLERGMTLMQALAVGGGLTPRGTQRGIEIRRRNGKDELEAIKPPLETALRSDDVVYVKESWF